jgi:hypothetical protein
MAAWRISGPRVGACNDRNSAGVSKIRRFKFSALLSPVNERPGAKWEVRGQRAEKIAFMGESIVDRRTIDKA